MAAEASRAPVAVREQKTASPIAAACAALIDFDIDGMKPFDTSTADLARSSGEQAYALLHVIGAGWADSGDSPNADALGSLNPRLHEMALDGISRLVALSLCAAEAAR